MSVEENKAIVRRVEEAWNAGDLDALDALFAPDFVSHAAAPGVPPNLESAKMAHTMSMQAFPDRHTSVEDLIGEGDQVVVRVRMTGTNTGGLPWFGIPANGNKVDVQWISTYRLANGKIVEHSALMDLMGIMQQLGAIPAPAAAA
jgi:steroid delta-isomerase-like uncharacterized protein